jgi:hypothetical protein
MKSSSALFFVILTAPAALAFADTALTSPDSLPKVSCTEIKYSQSFLKRFPKAPAACVEGRVSDGVKYAKFDAKVFLNGPDVTTVNALNVAGDTAFTFSFKAPAGTQVLMKDGKSKAVSELKPGDSITFWMTENSLEAHAQPANTDAAWRMMPPHK